MDEDCMYIRMGSEIMSRHTFDELHMIDDALGTRQRFRTWYERNNFLGYDHREEADEGSEGNHPPFTTSTHEGRWVPLSRTVESWGKYRGGW